MNKTRKQYREEVIRRYNRIKAIASTNDDDVKGGESLYLNLEMFSSIVM